MEEIQFKTEFIDKEIPVILVEVSGYIDQANCDQLQKLFDELYESDHYNNILDFTDLSYMSSAGWGILVGDVKRFKERGGNIKICNMRPEVFEVFQMLEFYHILDEYYSVDEALKSFKGTLSPGKKSDKKKVIEEPSLDRLRENEFTNTVKDHTEEEETNTFDKIVSFELDENDIHHSLEAPKTATSDFINSAKMSQNSRKAAPEIEFKLDMKTLPLPEKIKKIVAMFPLISTRQIQKMLKHEDFGNVRIGILKLYRQLVKLNLENKVKRYRYYRSC